MHSLAFVDTELIVFYYSELHQASRQKGIRPNTERNGSCMHHVVNFPQLLTSPFHAVELTDQFSS